MKKFVGMLILFLVCGGSSVYSQQVIVGYVYDKHTQTPLNGVNVFTTNNTGTTTNAKGYFKLRFSTKVDTLFISHIGYQNQKIGISSIDTPVYVGLSPDDQSLREVKVIGYRTSRPLNQTAGSIHKLNQQDLQRYNHTSLQPALNNIPGVKMESRGDGGSRRISIRGSTLRSPWGVRNINVYWNGIPITSPNGSTPLEIIDVQTLSSAEVIKGPTSSIYGAGTGGTLLFQSQWPSFNEQQTAASFLVGSYRPYQSLDYYRTHTSIRHQEGATSIAANYVHQDNKGYREQESNQKDLLTLHAKSFLNHKQKLTIHTLHYNGGWELPGALDISQYSNNPRQADSFSIAADASVNKRISLVGLTHEYRFSNAISNRTTIYGSLTNKKNPYGTSRFYNGYKIETARGTGGRTEFTFQTSDKIFDNQLLVGGEWQLEANHLSEYNNFDGVPGTLKKNSRTTAKQFLGFAQWEAQPFPTTLMTLGLSYHSLTYQHKDLLKVDTIDFSGAHTFASTLSPRVSLVQSVGEHLTLHGSISQGFSAPTVWEISNPDGSMNTSLEAEKGTNYELGIRSGFVNNNLNMDISGYLFRLKNAILPETVAAGTRYRNAGKTKQYGLELTTSYQWEIPAKYYLTKITPWISYAHQSYYFEEFKKNGANYAGYRVTGVPPNILSSGLDMAGANGLHLYLSYRFVDAIPLNDRNTVYASTYHLFNGKISYEKKIKNRLNAKFFIGIDNMLDTRYSSFLQLNGYNGKYYNPAAGRSIYVGLQVGFDWPQAKSLQK